MGSAGSIFARTMTNQARPLPSNDHAAPVNVVDQLLSLGAVVSIKLRIFLLARYSLSKLSLILYKQMLLPAGCFGDTIVTY